MVLALSQSYKKACTEAVVRRRSVKRVFLNILRNSQESTCFRKSF